MAKIRKDYKCSFGSVMIPSPKFFKLLALNKLTWTNRKLVNGCFVYGFKDGHIVTTHDPLTGAPANPVHNFKPLIGTAGNVGVEGTKAFRDRVAKFLKRNTTHIGYDPSERRHV